MSHATCRGVHCLQEDDDDGKYQMEVQALCGSTSLQIHELGFQVIVEEGSGFLAPPSAGGIGKKMP